MILYKAKINTVIGCLYYLWTGAGNDPEVIFLDTDSKSLDDQLKQMIAASDRANTETGGSFTVSKKKCPLLEEKITAYLKRAIKDTGLKPLFMTGSVFERKVWNAARKIPFGKTSSYGLIAAAAGSPRAGRAAGNALGKNPVIIIVPCHRVIKSDGCCGGFSAGPDLKKKLLELEGINLPMQDV
ncbi:MAG: methylated-DNA--[protein]-cysteine S-methyltransferase [Actinomycetia bacterium]|nr:methylated-DNA--[protein]-cysteine S-methyltransferase [Actinomycetes bacterium]